MVAVGDGVGGEVNVGGTLVSVGDGIGVTVAVGGTLVAVLAGVPVILVKVAWDVFVACSPQAEISSAALRRTHSLFIF